MNIDVLDFTGQDAVFLEKLPFHHRDPFDRMIISQAITNDFKLISLDSKFSLYDCELIM